MNRQLKLFKKLVNTNPQFKSSIALSRQKFQTTRSIK